MEPTGAVNLASSASAPTTAGRSAACRYRRADRSRRRYARRRASAGAPAPVEGGGEPGVFFRPREQAAGAKREDGQGAQSVTIARPRERRRADDWPQAAASFSARVAMQAPEASASADRRHWRERRPERRPARRRRRRPAPRGPACAGEGKPAQPGQSGGEQAEKKPLDPPRRRSKPGRRARDRSSSRRRRIRLTTGRARGCGPDARSSAARAKKVSRRRRGPAAVRRGPQRPLANPIVPASPFGASLSKRSFAPKTGFMSTKAEFCRGRSRLHNPVADE